ncbi:uncharacterized protein LOC106764532 [Vigna radiata var. radiata]|uniref:Uncharacterized protein LOC106764532 n=1 Tax=Vigna radiata var. radiata TaxID=3916 RepID=A0A3Q0F227_VIGRR|nr:uncharacterized protein LOC106764532 [Vigna radiata var. radiata]
MCGSSQQSLKRGIDYSSIAVKYYKSYGSEKSLTSISILHSLAVFTNLNFNFDVSSLNRLFDAPAFLFFKDLTVDRITFRFSTGFPLAFTIELHGVRVVQSFEKPETEECVVRL